MTRWFTSLSVTIFYLSTMTKRLFIISGDSGAGKDYAADNFQEWIDIRSGCAHINLKFAHEGKTALENMLKIPQGSLNDREFRQQIAPNCQGRTYLQVLVDFFHHRDAVIGADLFPARAIERLEYFFNRGVVGYDHTAFITDMRSQSEADHLKTWLANNIEVLVYPIYIYNPAAIRQSSDRLSFDLLFQFPNATTTNNTGEVTYFDNLRWAVKLIDEHRQKNNQPVRWN